MNTQPSPTPRSPQQGSIVVILAIAMVMLIALLGSIQVGYTAYQKRELQKTADMAALSGVQELINSNRDCPAASMHTQDIAVINGSSIGLERDDVEPECLKWPNTEHKENAVRANVKVTQNEFLGGNTLVSATATAVSTQPVAVFSVGSRLLRLDPTGLVGVTLDSLGLSPNLLTILDHNGIINASVTPRGLLKIIDSDIDLVALNPQKMAELQPINLADIAEASISLIDRSELTAAEVTLLSNIVSELTVHPLMVRLFGDDVSNQGVISVATNDTTAALDSRINVRDLIVTSLLFANGSNAIALDANVLGLANASVRIVSPPTLAIGGKETEARSAQIEVFVELGPIDLGLAKVHLPFTLSIAKSIGKLEDLCSSSVANNEAVFSAENSIVDLCISQGSCSKPPGPKVQILSVGIDLKLPLVPPLTVVLDSNLPISLLTSKDPKFTAPPLKVGNTLAMSTSLDIGLGTAVGKIVNGLSDTTYTDLNIPLLDTVPKLLQNTVLALIGDVVSIANSYLLIPLNNLIGDVLKNLLETLGIKLGETDITLHSVQCGVPRLVQ
ncbi:pilus assembly protein TadG-related protein [Allopusillimonas ginsengisoli]|uniref:pilus assembly protein TadG-related protein n=1 Tax=Allopusillimonas ginsengisoli TaxID=453575 RepID=UPI00101EF16E|nr:pilus assembly protein TadG-related protein [Allopusillimonas ginsengisoli]TEA80198.1 hypothetical protein ERE07_04610 [Allopusillimonas ginsengisoli]